MRTMLVHALVVAAFALTAAGSAAQVQDTQNFDQVERGRYLAVVGDCSGCHTAPGGKPFAGGLALQTPFGTIVSANITSDAETGIGNLTATEFDNALREGRSHNGRRLYPAMPYTAYTKMSDADIQAMRAYFSTIEPVHNPVLTNQLPFPLNIRLAMLGWNMLNFTPGRFQLDPQKSAVWNRGAYIVLGPGHCGTCHTPKTPLGGDKTSQGLTGATLQDWFAPNITPDARKGIGGWSKDEIAHYLKTGSNAWTLASGPMAEAVSHSTSQMTDEDVVAIATYLKDSGGATLSASPAPLAADNKAMQAGAAIYKDACAACHKDSGLGEPGLFPRLAGSALAQSDNATTLTRIVLQGSRAVATATKPTGPAMPAFDWRLSDAQIADVLTYIRNNWGNAAPAVPAKDVSGLRETFAKTR